MAKNYGGRHSPERAKRGGPKILAMSFSFLLGYAAASFFDVDDLSQWVQEQFSTAETTALNSAPKAPEEVLPPKPKFEFYTLLTNDKVPKASQAASVPNPVTSTQNTTTPPESKPYAVPQGAYSVQVASFKARMDAERMKGNLTLKGFNVYVVPIHHPSRGDWFRVVVGPYANKMLAQKAQNDLARNERLQGMVTTG